MFFAGLLGLASTAALADCADPNFDWSATNPPVNVRHVFCGEFNNQGRPTGRLRVEVAAAGNPVVADFRFTDIREDKGHCNAVLELIERA